jgi:hypothetical protein
MPELTEQTKQKMNGAQRMTLEVAKVMGSVSMGKYKTTDALRFDLVCKLADLYKMYVPGFNEDLFFESAGYSKGVRRH